MNIRPIRIKGLGVGVATIVIGVGVVVFTLLSLRSKDVLADKHDSAILRTRMIRETSARSVDGSSKRVAISGAKAQEKPLLSKVGDGLAEEIEKTAEELQKALNEEDFEKVQKVIDKVMASKNLFLLRQAVAAARCFGRKALPELTGLAAAIAELAGGGRRSTANGGFGVAPGGDLLPGQSNGGTAGDAGADAGETAAQQQAEIMSDEAQQALFESMSAIEAQINGMSDANEKAELLAAYMKASTSEDVLILLSGQLKTILDDGAVLGAVVDIVENGGSPESVASAKDVYKFMTGKDYSGADAAQNWLDNYSQKPFQAAGEN